jgi:hypothetical protein
MMTSTSMAGICHCAQDLINSPACQALTTETLASSRLKAIPETSACSVMHLPQSNQVPDAASSLMSVSQSVETAQYAQLDLVFAGQTPQTDLHAARYGGHLQFLQN